MSEENFKANNFTNLPDTSSYTWSSPSNIALIKYWGKNKNQTPKNTSISFTLSNSRTITTLELNKKSKADNNILFEETILFESLCFLIALAIDDPIKPQPIMHTL